MPGRDILWIIAGGILDLRFHAIEKSGNAHDHRGPDGLRRRQKSGGEWNRLDAYDLEFHRRVREGYLELVKQEPGRWVVVDARQPWEEVQEALRKVILKQIK